MDDELGGCSLRQRPRGPLHGRMAGLGLHGTTGARRFWCRGVACGLKESWLPVKMVACAVPQGLGCCTQGSALARELF